MSLILKLKKKKKPSETKETEPIKTVVSKNQYRHRSTTNQIHQQEFPC